MENKALLDSASSYVQTALRHHDNVQRLCISAYKAETWRRCENFVQRARDEAGECEDAAVEAKVIAARFLDKGSRQVKGTMPERQRAARYIALADIYMETAGAMADLARAALRDGFIPYATIKEGN